MKRVVRSLLALAATLLWAGGRAEAESEDAHEAHERCMQRMSIAFTGLAPSADLVNESDPHVVLADLVTRQEFFERYAKFINAEFNPFPGQDPAQDLPYYLMKHVLEEGLPYHALFDGPFDLVTNPTSGAITVEPSSEGLGYFRSRGWLVRYAGNEPSGLRLTGAYRMLQNMAGIHLVAQNNAAGVAINAEGRKSGACAGCHYTGWTALDPIASILTRRKGIGVDMDFVKPVATSIALGDATVHDDKELVAALVHSDHFTTRACSLAFKFLRGREPAACDVTMFDACTSALTASGKIQDGLVAIASQKGFCQ